MRKAIVLFLFVLLVGSFAPSGISGSASPDRNTPTWRRVSGGTAQLVPEILGTAQALEQSGTDADRKQLKMISGKVRIAKIVFMAMDLVSAGGVQNFDAFGYDSVAIYFDPRQEFPGQNQETLEWINGAFAFVPAKGRYPIYVNGRVVQELLNADGGDDLKVAAKVSVVLVSELAHQGGAEETETLPSVNRQIDSLLISGRISPEEAEFLKNTALRIHQVEAQKVLERNRPRK